MKGLIKENSELKEEIKTKKLQKKITDNNLDDFDLLKKLKDYSNILLENSNLKQKVQKLRSKYKY